MAAKPYDQLTHMGRLRRQRRLVAPLLAQYPFETERADLISSATNMIYRVRAEDGALYVLRLVVPNWRTEENLRAEVLWLGALARDTDIPVPRIVPTKEGNRVAYVDCSWETAPRRGIVMSYLPGTLLGKCLTEANLVKMGELFGRLHLHGASWQPPPDFPALKFDRYLSRGEPERLFSPEVQEGIAPHQRAALGCMRKRVQQEYRSLDPDDLRVIHCDLWHENIKVYRGQLAPFDFEDTIWGYRLHDIAMAMLDLAEDVGMARYDRLLAAFRDGYERHLVWPGGDMVALQMGRILWRLNWYARFIPAWLPKKLAVELARFKHYERTGELAEPAQALP
jgi:Ser/Thr protein kinase RdoA (MazF antagonist)